MASGFGLPTRLLNVPSTSSALSASVSVLPIPPAPSFANFRFRNIGQQPRLLTRLTDSNQAQDGTEEESMSTSSDNDQRSQNAEQNTTPRSRPSLWQALAEQDAVFATGDNPNGQASANAPRSPVVEASVPGEQQPALAKERSTSEPDISTSATFPRSFPPSHTALQLPAPASSTNFDGNAARQDSGDSLASMDLGYPSASPAPSGTNDPPMEDVQPSHAPVRPSLPPSSRKYENLRRIHSHLQAIAPPNDYKPNLASAILLTNSAQKKADAVHAEVRVLHSSTQELLLAAQKIHATTSTLLKDAEEAKGLADGAKAEIERFSSAYTDRQSESGHNELNELVQSLGNWITGQEADEAALRTRRAQQLKLKKQKSDLVKASVQTSPNSLGATGPTMSAVPPISASAPQRQPLFYSPTPEIDVKIEPRTWSQSPLHPCPASASTAPDPSQRQAELRKLLKEKHRLSDEESPPPSSLDATHEQHRLEKERQRHLEEARKKQFEEVRIRKEEEDKREKDLQRAEERRKQEEQRQRELAQQEEQEQEEREKCEERRLREEMERKAHEESKRLREEEERRVLEEAEKKRARESLEAMRRARVDADRKRALEEAERKSREAEVQRKAQEAELEKKAQEEEVKRKAQEAQRKRLHLIRQQQEEELQAELRRAQEKAKEEQRKLGERVRLKAGQEQQEKLHQDQNMRRAQIQADKDKTIADFVQQTQAQHSHYLSSSDRTREMSLDLSPVVSTLSPIAKAPPASPLAPRASLNQQPSFVQRPPQGMPANGLASGPIVSHQTSIVPNGQTSMLASPQGNSSDPRSLSLPPVTCLSQSDRSSPASTIPPSQRTPTLSVYSLSGDSGNVPYRENNLHLSPPQAQAANIRHVVSALNLQPVTLVKAEPAHDDSKLLYPPSRDKTPVQPQITQEPTQLPTLQRSQIHPLVLQPQQPTTLLSASVSQTSPSLSAEPTNGPHTHTILDRHIPSSAAIIGTPHSHPSQPQQLQQPQQIPAIVDPISNQPQTQVPNRPVSAAGVQPQPQPNRPVSRNEVQQELILPSTSQISGRSRSSSPFRMGPDTYVAPPLATDSSPPDISSDSLAPPTGPVSASFRGRLPPSTSIPPAHWDHYSPSPQRPRSPPVSRPRSPPSRQADTYRPNYSDRGRSPVQIGRKRSREDSPGPYIRDYRDRDYVDRRAPPLRRSRTPPPWRAQSRRTPSRSRSSSPGHITHRPSLATRLGPGPPPPNDNSYRPATPPRDWERDREPNLLSRFSDARTTGPLPPKPGRARGKRGRGGGGGGGGGGGPPTLEERISSGSTLAKRIQEDPRDPDSFFHSLFH